jgi:hypothetical protein
MSEDREFVATGDAHPVEDLILPSPKLYGLDGTKHLGGNLQASIGRLKQSLLQHRKRLCDKTLNGSQHDDEDDAGDG